MRLTRHDEVPWYAFSRFGNLARCALVFSCVVGQVSPELPLPSYAIVPTWAAFRRLPSVHVAKTEKGVSTSQGMVCL